VSEALSASLEDYLEEILWLVEQDDAAHAHVKDIAKRLSVKMPSVTGALRALAERKLVNYQPYGTVRLTKRGRKAAENVRRRHRIFSTFFVEVLGVDAKTAEETACRMEHVVDDTVLERLSAYLEFAENCPLGACRWDGGFGRFFEHGGKARDCTSRLKKLLSDFQGAKKGESGVKHLTLDDVKPGQKVKIVSVRAGQGPTNRRIVDMGVTRGTIVEVERVAPLGDPIEVKVKDYHLSLRKEEARGISVEPESGFQKE